MKSPACFLALPLVLLADPEASGDVLLEDFEEPAQEESSTGNDPWLEGEWTFSGSAFEGYGMKSGVRISGKLAHWYPGQLTQGRLKVRGSLGRSLLKSWGRRGGEVDGATGRALSPTFEIRRKYLRFLVSGGRYPGATCLNLLVDGQVVRSVTGNNSNNLQLVAMETGESVSYTHLTLPTILLV